MQGVGPGSLLGGRYLVQRRVSQHSRYERWVAADQTLDREVVLLCFDADGPVASPALDAARRAAGVDEPRLVRVLDVGRDDATAFVVEESLNGARSVTSVLTDGGLPAEEARRIVGEAASALERARARGLHHGVLTPWSVGLPPRRRSPPECRRTSTSSRGTRCRRTAARRPRASSSSRSAPGRRRRSAPDSRFVMSAGCRVAAPNRSNVTGRPAGWPSLPRRTPGAAARPRHGRSVAAQ